MTDRRSPSAAKERAEPVDYQRRARAALRVLIRHGLQREYLTEYRQLSEEDPVADDRLPDRETTTDDFVRYCCGDPDCPNDCEREQPPVDADRLPDAGSKWQKPTPEVVRQRLGWWSWFTAAYWFLSGIGIGIFIGWGIWVTHAF